MKIYLLVIILFFIFYLAYNFKEGLTGGMDNLKYSADLNKYCKDTDCKIIGNKTDMKKLYIKNADELLPVNISSPFIINFYNMLKNCKLNSNCYYEKSQILKDLDIEIEPNQDGYINFICDKNQINSLTPHVMIHWLLI